VVLDEETLVGGSAHTGAGNVLALCGSAVRLLAGGA